ncbi:MAG: hypothetical protein Roseis2KO_15250 [Roseivirga sp.]
MTQAKGTSILCFWLAQGLDMPLGTGGQSCHENSSQQQFKVSHGNNLTNKSHITLMTHSVDEGYQEDLIWSES